MTISSTSLTVRLHWAKASATFISAPLCTEATPIFLPLRSQGVFTFPSSIRSFRTVTQVKSNPLRLEPLSATIFIFTPRAKAFSRPVPNIPPPTSSSPPARGATRAGPEAKGTISTSRPCSRKYPFSLAM